MSFYTAIVVNFKNHSSLKIQKIIDFADHENILIDYYQSKENENKNRIEAKIFIQKIFCYY